MAPSQAITDGEGDDGADVVDGRDDIPMDDDMLTAGEDDGTELEMLEEIAGTIELEGPTEA